MAARANRARQRPDALAGALAGGLAAHVQLASGNP